jgi:hypothetical protein
MAYTGIATGVPTSTLYVPPDGVGSWKGIVHNFRRTRPGGYIRSDSVKEKAKQKKQKLWHFLSKIQRFSTFYKWLHTAM